MTNKYNEEDLLALSGIQHFAFCKRQWALIHIENQWFENLRTVEGRLLHARVDNPDLFEARGDTLTSRSVPIASYSLGLYGVADMVEFYATEEGGVPLEGREGLWLPVPVEYKRGSPKDSTIDEVQLCAQAICLEEMLSTQIGYGYIYYGTTKHRTKVLFDVGLREQVKELSMQMHDLFKKGSTPKEGINDIKRCKACSLVNACIPKILDRHTDVRNYIRKYLE